MTSIVHRTETGGALPPATVKVWDPLVRVFHWSLVVLFSVAFMSGDEIEALHLAAGYGIAGLVGLRLIWGVVGTRHARFGDFVRRPSAIAGYLRTVVGGRAPRHLGHNPAGGAMIVVMLALLTLQCATGILMTSDALWGSKALEEVHEALANLMLGCIALHLLGVAASSLLHGENLVRAMWSGRKRAP
ncbi:cytochrome b/b6 domain-containing protein [Desertibaculum subflavum]|uniref:cytochrome b/b6 domain-containing protein n=1 Tax=Desertibaculum subflavum TaxID=2268458 RepID=UPI000E6730E4